MTIDATNLVGPMDVFEADKIRMLCFLERYLKRPARMPAWR